MDTATSTPAVPAGGSAPPPESGSASTHAAVTQAFDRLSGSGEHDQPDVASHKAAPPTAVDQPRDQDGREAERRKAPSDTAPVAPLKPPQDWRAAAKEKWKLLPREVQEETGRIYAETRKVLDENANLRKATEPLRQTFAQHEQVIRRAGVPVHQVVGAALRMFSVLDSGQPQERAALLAHLVRGTLGADENGVRLLAQALDGSAVPEAHAAPSQPTHEELEGHIAARSQQMARAMLEQQLSQMAVGTWKAFEASKPEFLEWPGFRQRLAAELDIATRGRRPAPADIHAAYEAACEAHPHVRNVTAQRKQAAAAKAKASTPAAAAAAGIKSEPTGPAGQGKTKSTFDEVARQYDRLSRPRRI